MRSIYRILIVSLAVFSLAGTAWAGAAGKKPKYFVDESELPFAALPNATAHWGVVGGAGFRAEVPDA
jgi:hypothetical protein